MMYNKSCMRKTCIRLLNVTFSPRSIKLIVDLLMLGKETPLKPSAIEGAKKQMGFRTEMITPAIC